MLGTIVSNPFCNLKRKPNFDPLEEFAYHIDRVISNRFGDMAVWNLTSRARAQHFGSFSNL